MPDPDERRWIEPRIAHLLGLDDGAAGDQENLFSAWRILFERLAEKAPTVLVFEDMQWADEGLLDFLEYLLEWSRNQPLYVLALARPELAESGSSWGAGKRSFTSLYLEPLSPAGDGASCWPGSCRACRRTCGARILERAEGVPLYAVETVRMLLDRGLLVRDGSTSTGRPGAIEHARGARDAACARRRPARRPDAGRAPARAGRLRARQDVHEAGPAAAHRALDDDELEPLLASLLRKEMLSIQADPRSPERGQYAFLQDIVKQRRLRDALEAGAQGEAPRRRAVPVVASWSAEEDEIVEVVAAHYLDAYQGGARRPGRRGDPARRRARCSSARASAQRRSARTPRRSARTSGRSS